VLCTERGRSGAAEILVVIATNNLTFVDEERNRYMVVH